MSKEDIERMVRDAEAHAADDKARKEEAEIRNSAEGLVYQTEKLINEQGDKLDETLKAQAAEGIAQVKAALEGTDLEAIKTSTDALMKTSQELSTKLYEAATQDQGSAENPATNDDDVVDAEIVDEK